jgi:hypothetical protein
VQTSKKSPPNHHPSHPIGPAHLRPTSRHTPRPGTPLPHWSVRHSPQVLARLCPIGPAHLHPIGPARWAHIPARLSPSSRPAQSPGMPPTHIPPTLVLARLCPIGPARLHPIGPARWAYAPSSGTPPPLIPARSKSESRHASAPHPARLPHRSGSPLPHLPGTLPPSDRHTSAPHTCAPPGPRPDPPPPLGPVCLRSSARL